MKKSLYHITLIFFLFPSLSFPNCEPESPDDPIIYANFFRWGLSRNELLDLFNKTYQAPERLSKRAYIEKTTNQVHLPYETQRGGVIKLPPSFINSIQSHIEQAHTQKYIDGVFFPDMGHSHLLIPLDLYNSSYSSSHFSNEDRISFYEKIFTDPNVLVLYHTAEQLQFLDDSNKVRPDTYSQWRYKTRNLVGTFNSKTPIQIIQNPEHIANTANAPDGYYWWGEGFYISANKNGCFEYKNNLNQILRFDVTMNNLTYPPTAFIGSDL